MTAPRSIAEVCEAIGERDGYMLRPWRVGDAPSLVAAWADPEIARWNPVPPDASINVATGWIEGAQRQASTSAGIDVVLIEQTEPDVVIGEVGLQIDRRQYIGEIGFWVGEAHRGQGHGRLLLEFGLELGAELAIRGAVAMVDPENEGAQVTLRSAGWTEIPATGARLAFASKCEKGPSDG